jgi:hypothetical protein
VKAPSTIAERLKKSNLLILSPERFVLLSLKRLTIYLTPLITSSINNGIMASNFAAKIEKTKPNITTIKPGYRVMLVLIAGYKIESNDKIETIQ